MMSEGMETGKGIPVLRRSCILLCSSCALQTNHWPNLTLIIFLFHSPGQKIARLCRFWGKVNIKAECLTKWSSVGGKDDVVVFANLQQTVMFCYDFRFPPDTLCTLRVASIARYTTEMLLLEFSSWCLISLLPLCHKVSPIAVDKSVLIT